MGLYPIQTNNGYQIMMKTKDLKQKTNYEMENQFNNTNPNNRNMIGNKNYGEKQNIKNRRCFTTYN